MRVLVTGATGFVGTALLEYLRSIGAEASALARGAGSRGGCAAAWDPKTGTVLAGSLEGFDAVVHLAADNISEGRWTSEKKRRIRESRTVATTNLSRALAALTHRPKVMVSASAEGYYGDRGDEILDENSSAGKGFLADVCREWEASTELASRAGIRVCHLRIGAVLDPSGGALAKMSLPFRLGVGGPLGSGRQWFSWIVLSDLVRAIHHIIERKELSGAVNAVSPNPVTNAEFTKSLARVLHRPAIFRLPRVAARIALGEVADAVLYASMRVRPEALLTTGFRYDHPELEPALRALFRKV